MRLHKELGYVRILITSIYLNKGQLDTETKYILKYIYLITDRTGPAYGARSLSFFTNFKFRGIKETLENCKQFREKCRRFTQQNNSVKKSPNASSTPNSWRIQDFVRYFKVSKVLKCLDQCFARLRFQKSVSSKTAVDPASKFS